MSQSVQGALALNSTASRFSFGDHPVRIIMRDGEPWFVASDVCDALGYANSRKATADHLDADEKGVTTGDTLGGKQKMQVINESGLYALVLRSRKPEARKFAKWVTSKVLPSIRKTGSYGVPTEQQIALAIQTAAAVQTEVLNTLAKGGEWKFARWLLAFTYDGKPYIQTVPEDAYVASLPRLASMIDAPDFMTGKPGYAELGDLARAINARLSRHLSAECHGAKQ